MVGKFANLFILLSLLGFLSSACKGLFRLHVGERSSDESASGGGEQGGGSGPKLQLTGHPTGSSRFGFLAVSAGGAEFTAYRYKVGTAAATDCTSDAGYSSELPLTTTITDDIATLADTELEICAIGKKTDGSWQSLSEATSATWTKDMTPVVEARFAAAPLWLDYVSPAKSNAACDAAVDTDCVHGGEVRQANLG